MPQLRATEHDNITLIDSMPIEACRCSRAKNCKILKEDEQRGLRLRLRQRRQTDLTPPKETIQQHICQTISINTHPYRKRRKQTLHRNSTPMATRRSSRPKPASASGLPFTTQKTVLSASLMRPPAPWLPAPTST